MSNTAHWISNPVIITPMSPSLFQTSKVSGSAFVFPFKKKKKKKRKDVYFFFHDDLTKDMGFAH